MIVFIGQDFNKGAVLKWKALPTQEREVIETPKLENFCSFFNQIFQSSSRKNTRR